MSAKCHYVVQKISTQMYLFLQFRVLGRPSISCFVERKNNIINQN